MERNLNYVISPRYSEFSKQQIQAAIQNEVNKGSHALLAYIDTLIKEGVLTAIPTSKDIQAPQLGPWESAQPSDW